MNAVYWLLVAQGAVGAFDTLYFHEWRARLPARVPGTSPELVLHAARDFIYAVIFGTLPWVTWNGTAVTALVLLFAAEIAITLTDFVVEVRVRKSIGGVYPGERVTHAAMGIIYGAMLANIAPVMRSSWSLPTGLARIDTSAPIALRWTLSVMALGVFASGVRDLCAVAGLRVGRWPWRAVHAQTTSSASST
jgi:hypothetical protein